MTARSRPPSRCIRPGARSNGSLHDAFENGISRRHCRELRRAQGPAGRLLSGRVVFRQPGRAHLLPRRAARPRRDLRVDAAAAALRDDRQPRVRRAWQSSLPRTPRFSSAIRRSVRRARNQPRRLIMGDIARVADSEVELACRRGGVRADRAARYLRRPRLSSRPCGPTARRSSATASASSTRAPNIAAVRAPRPGTAN